jgi:predicted transcriptional regulator
MKAKDIVSKSIKPIRLGEEAQIALRLMTDQSTKHLPVLKKGKLVGVLSEDTILTNDLGIKIDELPMNIAGKYVNCDDHLFEILKHMGEHNMSIMPVVKKDLEYFGTITQNEIIKNFANTESITELGAIIILEVIKRDYSLADISKIVEGEGYSIIGTLITISENPQNIEVAIKVNTTNIRSILATFERYQYNIKATYEENDYSNKVKDRFDSLMTYLNV